MSIDVDEIAVTAAPLLKGRGKGGMNEERCFLVLHAIREDGVCKNLYRAYTQKSTSRYAAVQTLLNKAGEHPSGDHKLFLRAVAGDWLVVLPMEPDGVFYPSWFELEVGKTRIVARAEPVFLEKDESNG